MIFLKTICLLQANRSTPPPLIDPFIHEFVQNYTLYIPLVALFVALLSLFVASIGFLFTHFKSWFWELYDTHSLKKHLQPFKNTPAEIKQSLNYYIEPYVQNLDPSGGEEPRATVNVKNSLFLTLDDLFSNESKYNHIILLADSGMGKTSALMNYTARHIRSFGKGYKIKLIPLGVPNAIKYIEEIQDKANTVLLLDAFDEDTRAKGNHDKRFKELMNSTFEFRRVLISCRTQFFTKDEEIPLEPGILRTAPRSAGEPASYILHKLYLSPFTEKQGMHYIKRRYPLWKLKFKSRRRALKMVKKIEHLAARPMLLSHIDVLIKNNGDYTYSYQIYEEMVKEWLARERGHISDEAALRRFSELLAVDLYLRSDERQAEHIPYFELVELARQWNIPIEGWKHAEWELRVRSLLNRDAVGNYKFAHRSILEYLFVKSYDSGNERCLNVEWTDQMQAFYWEFLEHRIVEQQKLYIYNIEKPNLNQFSIAHENFLKLVTLQGLSQLESPIIADKKIISILKTATALCGYLLDPNGADDPFVSLIMIRTEDEETPVLIPMAIYYHGALMDVKKAEGLKRFFQSNEKTLYYSKYIPNVDDSSYPEILLKLRRVYDVEGITCIYMPIKMNGKHVALLMGSSSKEFAFNKDRQLVLVGILKALGKYLWKYRLKL